MTFDADETSISDSQPVDLYEILTPIAVYRITTSHRDVVFGGNTYTSAVTARGQQTVTPGSEPREFTVYLPVSHPFAQRYLAFGIPPKTVNVAALRYQRRSATAIGMWAGEVTAISADGGIATLLVPTVLSNRGQTKLPIVASRTCNNALYDLLCTIAKASFQVSPTPTILSLADGGLTVVISGMGGKPDGWASRGHVEHATSNESRTVIAQVGTTLTLDVPLIGAAPGQTLDVFAGCVKTVDVCLAKFANVVNFQGEPELNGTINLWGEKGLGTVQQS